MSKHSSLAPKLSLRARESARRRRHRDLKVESLEPRIALAADTISRPALEAATGLYVDPSMMGPAPIVFGKSEIVGNDVKSFVVTSVANGVVEKWNTARNAWVDVSTKPTSSNPRELMSLLAGRVIHRGDQLRWLPAAGDTAAARKAFEIIGWDDGTELQPTSSAAPTAVQNLAATPTGVGQLTLAWDAPATGTPTSYTVTMTATTTSYVSGTLTATTNTTITTTTATSMPFTGLSGSNFYTFAVVANNASGGGAASATATISANAGVGIVTDGTPFTGGGFDGDGNAYSWEALGSSSTLPWNGVTFALGSPNKPNVIHAAGQVIAVPQGDYNVLSVAGAAANGPQINQNITLTFTDNSTLLISQSFSDWCEPEGYSHESIVSTQSYRDTAPGGTNQSTNYVYGYSYTLPTQKTLQSITLPTIVNLGFFDFQMSKATSVDLSTQYTRWGIANGKGNVSTNNSGFDGHGNYYYSGDLKPTIAWSGATFAFGAALTASNFVQAQGQSIDLPQGDYRWLYLAGAAANGSQQNQQFTLTFSDGSTAVWTQSFSYWCQPSFFSGESIIQTQMDWVTYHSGTISPTAGPGQYSEVKSQNNCVYGYAYQIPAGKTLVSVTLPNNSNNLGILGMAML